jgi:radical SAM protein with 4Fe4S-binding SPASM domain
VKLVIQHIAFEITRQCNLKCRYCYNYWRRDDSQPSVSSFSQAKQTLKRIFKEIDFEHISMTGGEPFLADGLKELVLYCRMKSKAVTIISNGTVGNNEDYKILFDLGISFFEFPLHSPFAEAHDYLTNSPGSFQRVLSSLRATLEMGAPIAVVFVLTKINAHLLPQTLLFAEQLGIRNFMLARFNIGGRGIRNSDDLVPSKSIIRSAFQAAKDYTRTHKMRITANVCVPHCIIKPADYPDLSISSCGSNPVKRPVTIDYRGNVRMCNHSPHVIGNIFKDSAKSLLSSEYVGEWNTSVPSYCADCNKWSMCKGGCRAASEQMGLPLSNADPIISMLN